MGRGLSTMSVKIEPVVCYQDHRGNVFEPLDPDHLPRQRHVHVVVTEPGCVRGNHVHTRATEVLRACKNITSLFRNNLLSMVRDRLSYRDFLRSSDTLERVMPSGEVHRCQCSPCQQEAPHPDQGLHHHMNLWLSRLDEQQRRWYAAIEANRLGHGGEQLVAQITGLEPHSIRRGRQELAVSLAERPTDRVRVPGAGRPRAEKKTR